jgi:hypothetical protein
MKLTIALVITLLVAGSAFANSTDLKTQTLCGWFDNPTPANAWLYDRNGEWTIGIQGGHQAEGDWPSFKDSQWVKTNRHYGYGCACIKGIVNVATHEVVSITSAKAQSLSICRKDRALKEPKP